MFLLANIIAAKLLGELFKGAAAQQRQQKHDDKRSSRLGFSQMSLGALVEEQHRYSGENSENPIRKR